VSLPADLRTPKDPSLPGDIAVETPRGDILSSKAGILQIALDGNVAGGPKVTLRAGSPATATDPAIPGNVDLGDSGLIGGNVEIARKETFVANRLAAKLDHQRGAELQRHSARGWERRAFRRAAPFLVRSSHRRVNASAGGVNSASLLGQMCP